LQTSFQGNGQAYLQSLKSTPILIVAALVVIYLILGILYESIIHPITILSTLPSAGIGALMLLMAFWLRFERDRHRRDPVADRHRQEERHHDDRLRHSCRAGARSHAGAIDLSGLHQALPADSHDDDGRDAWRRAAHDRHRNRLRNTRAARLCHRRRVGPEPVLDALYHTRRLPVSRSLDQTTASAVAKHLQSAARATPGRG